MQFIITTTREIKDDVNLDFYLNTLSQFVPAQVIQEIRDKGESSWEVKSIAPYEDVKTVYKLIKDVS